jgi:hypothetical protein
MSFDEVEPVMMGSVAKRPIGADAELLRDRHQQISAQKFAAGRGNV